jgi:hypothetical protein
MDQRLLTLTCCDGGTQNSIAIIRMETVSLFMAVRIYLGREIKLHSYKGKDFPALISITNYKVQNLAKNKYLEDLSWRHEYYTRQEDHITKILHLLKIMCAAF